jgi:carboxylesterase type B
VKIIRPICPQPHLPFPQYWDETAPSDTPIFPRVKQSEFDCLNLSITVPRTSLDHSAPKVPVLVFIHGGAFVGGSLTVRVGAREICDGFGLVRTSIASGLKVITVTINYRLGPLGFLASKELAAFNTSHAEPVGNYGLHDQRQALLWIKSFIGGFGGDAKNVTIYGTSAGGASCHYLSIRPKRNFKRAIISSATLFGIGAMPVEHRQSAFDDFTARFAAGSENVVQTLQGVPVQEFVNTVKTSGWAPLMDDEWISQATLYGREDDDDPPDLMIGSCNYEVS